MKVIEWELNLTECAPLTWLEADVVASAGFVNLTWQQEGWVQLLSSQGGISQSSLCDKKNACQPEQEYPQHFIMVRIVLICLCAFIEG